MLQKTGCVAASIADSFLKKEHAAMVADPSAKIIPGSLPSPFHQRQLFGRDQPPGAQIVR
ncbi:hypothetical protein [Paraburkholderia flava]|uniref:hypothetical protein n=1 Tax=Paraburkholderia flava TaxID=2547393 RepID=UPI00105BBF2E|nr:hypothetical protein [Paraburkholderia flava]